MQYAVVAMEAVFLGATLPVVAIRKKLVIHFLKHINSNRISEQF